MENACNNQRIQYFDCARGIAMILVVASHIWAFTDIRYILFATTHNPTFFLVSGCLLVGSLTNKNRGGVLLKKAESLLIPYVVWVCILGSISTFFDHSHIIGNLIIAAKELWFFPTLFMFEAVLILFIEIFKKKKYVTGLGLILLLMACFIAVKQASIARRLFFFGLVVLGYCTQKYTEKTRMMFGSVSAVLYILFMFVAGRKNYFTSADNLTPGYKLIFVFGLSFLGACTILLLSKCLAKPQFCGFLCLVGKNTLYIYVLHYAVLKILNSLLTNKYCLLFICVVVPIIIQYFIKGTLIDNLLFKPYIVCHEMLVGLKKSKLKEEDI